MGAAEHLSEDFRKKNPQATVPTFEDTNGDVIWDRYQLEIFHLLECIVTEEFFQPCHKHLHNWQVRQK